MARTIAMSSKGFSFLQVYRRKAQITQAQMAHLLGFSCRSHVSRIERGECNPSLEVLLVYKTLFGVSLRECFPELSGITDERLMQRAQVLFERLKSDKTKKGERQREALMVGMKRAIIHLKQQTDD